MLGKESNNQRTRCFLNEMYEPQLSVKSCCSVAFAASVSAHLNWFCRDWIMLCLHQKHFTSHTHTYATVSINPSVYTACMLACVALMLHTHKVEATCLFSCVYMITTVMCMGLWVLPKCRCIGLYWTWRTAVWTLAAFQGFYKLGPSLASFLVSLPLKM